MRHKRHNFSSAHSDNLSVVKEKQKLSDVRCVNCSRTFLLYAFYVYDLWHSQVNPHRVHRSPDGSLNIISVTEWKISPVLARPVECSCSWAATQWRWSADDGAAKAKLRKGKGSRARFEQWNRAAKSTILPYSTKRLLENSLSFDLDKAKKHSRRFGNIWLFSPLCKVGNMEERNSITSFFLLFCWWANECICCGGVVRAQPKILVNMSSNRGERRKEQILQIHRHITIMWLSCYCVLFRYIVWQQQIYPLEIQSSYICWTTRIHLVSEVNVCRVYILIFRSLVGLPPAPTLN